MPSFDIVSEVDWQEIDNAINQTIKEVTHRFDFKGIESKITADQKAKTLTLWCSQKEKLDSLKDTFQSKLVKRGVSLLSFEYKDAEPASGASGRQTAVVAAGISKENGKKIISSIKDKKFKVQAQIQDEQVRVTGKKRDDLQDVIGYLKQQQTDLKLPLQFINFRD